MNGKGKGNRVYKIGQTSRYAYNREYEISYNSEVEYCSTRVFLTNDHKIVEQMVLAKLRRNPNFENILQNGKPTEFFRTSLTKEEVRATFECYCKLAQDCVNLFMEN
jgi:hypothetical protein